MGQRFQIIENTNGKFKVYHIQWLWGDYAIRRIGTAVRGFLIHNKEGHRSFEDFLKSSFYGKPNDMNSFSRYFENSEEWSDNKELLVSHDKKGNKKLCEKKSFNSILKDLDNNDGYFYVEFSDKFINGQTGLKGYCFIPGFYGEKNFECVTANEYVKINNRTTGFDKKQEKEFNDGLKTFSKLKKINPPKYITN